MTTLLYKLKQALRGTTKAAQFIALVNRLYKEKDNGFYVYAYAKLTSATNVVDYMIRYIGRPVIAQKRILKYENKIVTFCYNRHEDDEYVEEAIPVFDFLKRLIIHIPDKHFNMIRYYGLYAKKHDLLTKYRPLPLKHSKLINSWQIRIWQNFNYNPLKCTCGKQMKFCEIFPPNSS